MRPKTIRQSVKHILSDSERLEYGRAMSRANENIIAEETRLSSLSSQIKGNIKVHDAELRRCSALIRDGFEYRDMDCSIVYDFEKGIKTFHRPDTFEQVGEDIITEKELQEDAMEPVEIPRGASVEDDIDDDALDGGPYTEDDDDSEGEEA